MQDHKSDKESGQESSVEVQVTLLDGGQENICISERCLGQELFALVTKKIGVFEYEYFGLLYCDFEGNKCWIDNNKPLTKALRNSSTRPLEFLFAVKFFTPYPNLLEDDLTRYLYALQIRNDFFQGLLHSNRNTSLLLAAFIAQSQLGDFQETECRSYAYLKKHHMFRTAPDSYLMRLMELHQTLIGITKSEADYRLLDAARKVELYGIRLHAAKTIEDKPVNMGVNHVGIMIFENFSRLNTFNWSMIRKLSFKRRKLLIKLHMEAYGYGNDTIEFSFSTRNSCKNFWKKCIEQHTFFRSVSPYDNRKSGTSSRGSGVFTYSSANLFSFPFSKLRRSASCGANGLSSSRKTLKSNDEENSVSCNTKSSQNSHLSTPVKRMAHLSLTGSNFHYTGRTQKQIMESNHNTLHDNPDNIKFSSEYNSSSLKINPYCDDDNKTTSMRRKSHALAKLLAQKYPLTSGGGARDHLELFRLSFTSLIPYPSSSFDNNNNNMYDTSSILSGRNGFKWNCNRAVSTSSIDRQVTYCKRKLSTHSYVPRHFSGTISRQSSASQDVHTIDWSDSKYYNEQYNFINHVVKDPSSRYLSKDSVNISKPSENASTFSSSCSLTSESYPRPVSYDEPLEYTQFLLTSKNDLSHLQICELDYSADEKDTSPMSVISTRENIQSFTNSIQSPLMLSVNQTCEKETYDIHKKCNDRLTEKEDFSTSNKSLHKLISDVDSQQTIASTDTDNDEEAFSKLTNNVSLKKVITSVNAYSIVNHQIMEDNNIYEPYSPSQVSGGNFEVFSQDDDTRQSEEEKRNEDDRSNQSKSETDPGQNETASVDVSLVDLHSPRKSRDNSLFNSLIAFSEDISSKDDKSRLASMTDVAQSELLDDLESDIQSDQLMNVDEAPESLADAISLGAISLITGLSDDDSGGDDDNLYNSKHDDILNKTSVCRDSDQGSKVKLSKSLSHLPVTKNNSHLRQNTSSNMDNVEAGKTKIESSALTTCELVRAKSQQLFSKCTTPSRHSPKESDSLIPSMLSSHNISTPDFNGTSHKVDQNISELLTIASGCLNIFKEVLLTESMYSHQLEFLLTFKCMLMELVSPSSHSQHDNLMTPLDMASLFNVIPLMNWLQNRLLPLLKPIIDRQKSFLHQLKIIVSTLKHIISRVKVFSKQLLSKSKDDGVESLFQSSKINHESSMFTNRMSKVYLSSSESSLSHTVPQLNKNEDFSSSELSSFYLSPHFIKHKHKKCGMHSALKELQSLSCCVNLLMNLLDQLQCYEIWIKNSANLLSELWMLAFLDILGLHSNRDTELVNSHINVNTDSQIDKMQVANTENHFDNSVKYSPALIRKVLCDLENRSSIGSLWDYLLLPSRRFRSYCNLLQSIVNQLSEHSSSVLCQTVFSQFVLSRRSLINILDQTERVALALQLSIIVFPLDKFFYTSDNYVNENAQERDNLANDGQKHQNNTSTTYQSYSKYDNDEDIIESLQINSTALLDSLNRCPVIRFGWLNKYSRHGFQPRLVFLFTEHLIYASRIRGVAGLYLKIHGIISLSNIAVERNVPRKDHGSSDETSDQNKQLKCFKFGLVVTYSSHSPVHGLSEESNSCVTSRNSNPSRVSKSQSPCRYRLRRHRKRFIFGVYDEFDYEAWIGDISRLAAEVTTGTTASLSNINDSRIPNRTQLYKHTGIIRLRNSCTSNIMYSQVAQRCLTDVNTNRYPSDSDVIQSSPQKSTALIPSFRNNLIGFCWRQHASVSSVQLLNIIDNEISGYLFRLSKRGTGSKQKLWTVLSDMCLKFYKTYHHHKLLARLWLSTNKCTAELLPTNLLPFGYNLNEFEADEHHRRHCVRYSYFIKISNNSKDYYFQAENDFFLKRWYTAISNTLTCSTTKLNRIETTLTDDNLILVNESLSTLSLLTTSDAKLIFTCRPLCSDKLKE